MIKFILLLLLVLIPANSIAETQSTKLNELFKTLKKIDNTLDASEVEKEIWALWNKHPKSKQLTYKLELGTELMYEGNYLYALRVFDNIIKSDPKWSEAWNKRATVLYMIGDYQESQNDIDKVLNLEKRHFGALAGQGLVNIKLKNYEKAIESYEKAQEIYPAMQSPKIMIKEIQEIINQQLI